MNSDNNYKKILTEKQFKVLREKGTEAPFSGKLSPPDENGAYKCVACGNPLFEATSKFESGTGWPSFSSAIPDAVTIIEDHSHGMSRLEVVCSKCQSHLGHVFEDGPMPTGKRYCINSVCLS